MNNWVDAAIFVIYLATLQVVGYITAKWTKTFEDYAVAGRRMKAWLAFSTIAATWIGG